MGAFDTVWSLLKDEKLIQDAYTWDFLDEQGVPYYDSAMSPEWSHGLCGDMVCAVNAHLKSLGHDAEEFDVFHRETKAPHTVSKVGNFIIDYARRQFDESADVPTVETLDSFYRNFKEDRE